jgi:hypothetical protein
MVAMKTTPTLRRRALLAALVLVGSVFVPCAAAQALVDPPPRPLAEQAYLGLFLRDIPDSPYSVVSWILPGPLGGTNFESDYVNRGDIVLAIDGEPRSTDQYQALLEMASPGDVWQFRVQRGTGDINAAVPDPGGVRGEIIEFEITLGSRAAWSGPIVFPRPQRPILPIEPGEIESTLRRHAEMQGITSGLDDLVSLFADTQQANLGYHALDRVVAGFHHPLSIDVIGEQIIAETKAIPAAPLAGVHKLLAANLDLSTDTAAAVSDEVLQLDSVEALADALRQRVESASEAGAADLIDEALGGKAMRLVDVLARNVYIAGETEQVREHLEILHASLDLDMTGLVRQATGLYPAPLKLTDSAASSATSSGEQVVGVTGDLLHVSECAAGLIVIGGAGPNTFEMDNIAAVYDVGGDDVYTHSKPRIGKPTLIIDAAGNDAYLGTEPFAGPASAVASVSIVHDWAGDDQYQGTRHACAAGLFGIALILDSAGHDVYQAEDWSQGVGMFGAGLIVDLAGHDEYLGETRVQGVGGPKALGAIIDAAGNDLYRANGPHGSVYGTPAVYVGFSQAIGYGIRQYASGGIGLISDLGGHDRYEAGEFSQGGGYYWCLGLLHDAGGDDLYYANRYGQGFGCHQSLGMLIDEAGDDTYWSMTAASQGGSWDIGVGLLLDKAGNDAYRADGLSQGGASMQAIGLLVDLAGQDRYSGKGGATQGQSGSNTYNYNRTKCFSFSALVDFGEAIDFYSAGRANNSTVSTGALNEDDPQASSLYGLFLDGLSVTSD